MNTAVDSQESAYPVRLTVVRPDKQSRLLNFPLGIGTIIRAILIIPHALILYALSLVAWVLYFVATFAILFTGHYPAGMHKFIEGFLRWNVNVNGYVSGLYDAYPPFSLDTQQYPLLFDVDYPAQSSRLLNFPLGIGLIIRYVLLIPHLIALVFLGIVYYLVLFISQFAILFTGSFPAGMHSFGVGVTRWGIRIQAYTMGLTDRYPPFSLD